MLKRYFGFNLCALAVVLAIAMSAGLALGFTPPPIYILKLPIMIGLVTLAVYVIFTWLRPNKNVTHTMLSFFSMVVGLPILAMFSYVSVRLDGPKIDSQLSNFDQAIGFDWVSITNFLANYPELMSKASIIYTSTGVMGLVTFVAVGMFCERPKQVHELVTTFILGATTCSVIGGLLPADGFYVYSNISEEVMSSIRPAVNLTDMHMINQIRDGKSTELYIEGGLGVVSFPSFHTILSVLLIWAARGTGMFFIFSLIWNSAIILCTPIMGNHYVADVIGGLMLAFAVIWLTTKIYAYLDSANFDFAPTQLPHPVERANHL